MVNAQSYLRNPKSYENSSTNIYHTYLSHSSDDLVLGVKRQIMAVRAKVRSTTILNLVHNGCARKSSPVKYLGVKRQIMALRVKVRPSRIHVFHA